ncbi:Serine protease 56 [Zancudomyces culisetae]|uniref:Serine protease 56 n=1 Tax=Zancudomyces culisetae TaxID=1213189 RepID=A0A1R1PLI4_ZANCU|nr:Serine protease 56 [Zancudomyces culisetae]|eukprot:OMH81732.1 Serine protease 56 [Zancudomyces culisetae]
MKGTGIISATQQKRQSDEIDTSEKNEIDLSSGARVVNGTIAEFHDFPYAIFIYIDLGTGGEACAGSLIADNVVVTAAHCLLDSKGQKYPAKNVLLSAGSEKSIQTNTNRFSANDTFVFPSFDPNTLVHDIGLVILSAPIPRTIATPIPIYSGEIVDSLSVFAAGWGITSNGPNASISNVLNQVPLKVSSADTCKKLNGYWVNNNNYCVCTANANGQDTCYGDSGGPLVHKEQGIPTLVGLTSLGNAPGNKIRPECGMNGGVAYYTRIHFFIDWISSTTGINKLQLSYPSSNVSNTTVFASANVPPSISAAGASEDTPTLEISAAFSSSYSRNMHLLSIFAFSALIHLYL